MSPYAIWQVTPVAVRWSSNNSYTGPLTFDLFRLKHSESKGFAPSFFDVYQTKASIRIAINQSIEQSIS